MLEAYERARDPEKAARRRLDTFLKTAGVKILTSENISAGKLVDMYFSLSPPFEAKREKKHEFPDAIALEVLEKWGK